jgi:hypothetical protein
LFLCAKYLFVAATQGIPASNSPISKQGGGTSPKATWPIDRLQRKLQRQPVPLRAIFAAHDPTQIVRLTVPRWSIATRDLGEPGIAATALSQKACRIAQAAPKLSALSGECGFRRPAGADAAQGAAAIGRVIARLVTSPGGLSAMDQFVRRQRRVADLVRLLGASTTLIPPKNP